MNELYNDINKRLDILIQQYKRPINRWFHIKYPELYNQILIATSFLHSNACIHERIFYIRNNIEQQLMCEVCGKNPVMWNRSEHTVSRCCSNICNNRSLHKKQATEQTCLIKFGVKNPFQNEICKQKAKRTKYIKYGDEQYRNTEQILRTKSSPEWRKKFCHVYSDMWKRKTKAEMEHKAQTQKATKLIKYGDENYTNQAKARQTRKLKYGCENYNNKEKIQRTCIEKYGVPCYLLTVHNVTISKLNKRIFKILNRHHIYFNSEFRIGLKTYDIKFNNKILLEINGDFWHANPAIYKASDILNMPKGLRKASDIWKYDKLKKELAEQHGYKVVYIWESEMKIMTDDQIYDFITTILF